jgi:hypothetical protein
LLGHTFGGLMGGTDYSRLAGSETALGAKFAAGGKATVLEVVMETVEGCAEQSSFLAALAGRVAAEVARGFVAARDAGKVKSQIRTQNRFNNYKGPTFILLREFGEQVPSYSETTYIYSNIYISTIKTARPAAPR